MDRKYNLMLAMGLIVSGLTLTFDPEIFPIDNNNGTICIGNHIQEIQFQFYENMDLYDRMIPQIIIPNISISIYEVEWEGCFPRIRIVETLYEKKVVSFNESLQLPQGTREYLLMGYLEGYWPYIADFSLICEDWTESPIEFTDMLVRWPNDLNLTLYDRNGCLNLTGNHTLDSIVGRIDVRSSNYQYLFFRNGSYFDIFYLALQLTLKEARFLNYDLIGTSGIFDPLYSDSLDYNISSMTNFDSTYYYLIGPYRETGALTGMNITKNDMVSISLGYVNVHDGRNFKTFNTSALASWIGGIYGS